MAAPLRVFRDVIMSIKAGTFCPDLTRSGYFKPQGEVDSSTESSGSDDDDVRDDDAGASAGRAVAAQDPLLGERVRNKLTQVVHRVVAGSNKTCCGRSIVDHHATVSPQELDTSVLRLVCERAKK